MMHAESNLKSKDWPVRAMCLFTWGHLFFFFSFFFPSHRFSYGKTWFLEINSGSTPYPLYHLGCWDVRGDSPCQSFWLSLSQTRSSKVVPFSLVFQFMLPALIECLLWARHYAWEARSRVTSELIKLKLQNCFLHRSLPRPWEGPSQHVLVVTHFCNICKS